VRALGVDAAGRAGWVGVVVADDGFVAAHLEAYLGDLVGAAERHGPLDAVGVDIPIGLVAGATRSADVAMRRYVGPRRASVFAAPHPDVVHLDDHAEVNRVLAGRGLPRISVQAFHLFPRIREAAALVAAGQDLVETFPEASFTAMAGGPVPAAKKTWNGQTHRRRLLAGASPPIAVPDDLGAAGLVPVDDVLDAAACAWSALRRAHGTAEVVGEPTEVDPRSGRPIAVWV
jgi:predicted RNase H-like nuclease